MPNQAEEDTFMWRKLKAGVFSDCYWLAAKHHGEHGIGLRLEATIN